MNRPRALFSASTALAIAIAIGCSPSSGNGGTSDGGGATSGSGATDLNDGSSGAEDANGASCSPFLRMLCPPQQICCFTGIQGTCTSPAACLSAFRIGCASEADCPSGDACCGSGPGTTLSLSCQSACTPDQFQLCRSDQECPSGAQCAIVTRGFTTRVCKAVPDADAVSYDSGD